MLGAREIKREVRNNSGDLGWYLHYPSRERCPLVIFCIEQNREPRACSCTPLKCYQRIVHPP